MNADSMMTMDGLFKRNIVTVDSMFTEEPTALCWFYVHKGDRQHKAASSDHVAIHEEDLDAVNCPWIRERGSGFIIY